MTTLQSRVSVGSESYTITELLKNMKNAFNNYEALRWAFCIQTAFIKFGYNEDIDNVMKEILKSKDVPAIIAEEEKHSDKSWEMPDTLINYIFKQTFKQEQLKKLWRWINDYFIDKVGYPYQYLSLILFFENHPSQFLNQSHISNADMQTQIEAWYPKAKVKCSADAIGTYRNGFCNKESFRYAQWINSEGVPPTNYEYKKDQSSSGFMALCKLCNNLELNLSDLII